MATGKASWEEARDLIEKETGPISSATELSAGRNSEISVIVRSGPEATFVKGRRADHRWAWTQDRERIVNPLVRHVSPALKWHSVSDEWNLLGFECISGTHADYSPGSPDIPKVVDTLLRLQGVACPDGIEVKRAEQRWASYTETPELLVGAWLLHTEWTPGNVLISDRAYLVDWAWPTRGAAWIDPACLAVWLIACGHAPGAAESWAARIPSWRSAPAGALAEFARIQALMWAGIAADSPEGWPTDLASAAGRWASHRETRLPAPGAGMNDSRPQVHPAQLLVAPDGAEVGIDIGIVPLVRALWALGLATTASCQDFGEGTAGQRTASPHPSRYGGDAFIAYYNGYAWLKMPVSDALRLANMLLGTAFRDRVTRRWEPGSWRLHIPVVFDESRAMVPAGTAQIHFPKGQATELTLALVRMSRA